MPHRIAAKSFLPATAVLELTYACNHRCIFCSCPWEDPASIFHKEKELSTDQWKEIVTHLCSMGVMNLAFTGGESLLRHDLFEIIKHASTCETEYIETVNGTLKTWKDKPHLYLLSNGRLVDNKILKICKDHNVQLSMSLPGLSTYKKHTGSDDVDHILEMFTAAKSFGLKTVAGITVTRINLFELDRIISAALLAGADQILLNRFLPGGRGLQYAQELTLSAEEINEMLNIAEATLQTANRFGSLGTELPRCIVDPAQYKHLEIGTRCSAAVQFFVIGPSGYIRVCNHSPINLNHFSEIDNLKNNQYWKIFTQKNYMPVYCQSCHQMSACDGGCREAAHITGGSLDSIDPLLSGTS